MPVKELLLHLEPGAEADGRIGYAATLAARWSAHLVGLCVADIPLPVFAAADGVSGAALGALMQEQREAALAEAARQEARFRSGAEKAGVSAEWRLEEGGAASVVARHGRYADLVVVGQTDPDRPRPGGDAPIEAALFDSGRPVLVIPYAMAQPAPPRHALVGWNASREAARALHDALPLLALAQAVTIMSVEPETGPDAHGEEPGADIGRHLARHGLQVTVRRAAAPEVSAGEALLNAVADHGADLLVMGGYGHSRLREFILGGATRTVLAQMTVPVLMSH